MQLMCLIKCSHGLSSTLTSWGINFVVRSDAKVNQVLKSGAVRKHELLIPNAVAMLYYIFAQHLEKNVVISLRLQELMVHPPDMLNSLYTIRRFHTLQNELANARMYWTAPDCGESYASTAVVKEPTIGAFPSTNVAIGTSLADRTVVAMEAIITFLGLQIKEAESTMGSLGNMCSSFWWKLHRHTEKDYFNGDSCRRDCSSSFSWYDHINFLGSCFIFLHHTFKLNSK
ncbi:peroxin [Trifolium repens]|nr:peroxin [Trifolium repens]